jgi:hypothetical protein
MYEANGVTAEFPLPQSADGTVVDGTVVVLISPTGSAARVNAGEYTVQNGAVIFSIPPPAGWTVAFAMPANTPALSVCTLVYPDGTMKQMAQDPTELLAEAKTERDEAKKLLREAKNALEATERVIHVESEIAKEKLSARLEKYGSLVEDSIAQAANGARDELLGYLALQMKEVRERHDETIKARDEALKARDAAQSAAEQATFTAVKEVMTALKGETEKAVNACEQARDLKSEITGLRDQAQTAAATTGERFQETIFPIVNAVIDQARSLAASAGNEIQTAIAKASGEMAGLITEARAARDASQAAANRAQEAERRSAELERTQIGREEGMRALWTRILGFKKTFDHRVSQMRGSASNGSASNGENPVIAERE